MLIIPILTTFLTLSGCLESIQASHNGSTTIEQLLDAINLNVSLFEDQYNKLKNQSYEIAEQGHSDLLNILANILEEVVDSFPITEGIDATAKLEEEAEDLGVDITTCTTNVNFKIEQLHEIADTIIDLNKTYVLYMNQWDYATNTDLNSLKSTLEKYENESKQCLKNLENTAIVKLCLLQVLTQLNMAVALLETQSKIMLNGVSVYMEQMKVAVEEMYIQHVNNWPEQVDHMVDYLSECVENILNRNETVMASFVQ